MNRRQLIKGIGAAIIAGRQPVFLASLIQPVDLPRHLWWAEEFELLPWQQHDR